MFKRKCKITYICHGATVYSEDIRFCTDKKYPPLEEVGQEEIKKICDYIRRRGVKSDKIFSGPETRCIQSAQMVAKVFKQDFDVISELYSRNWGKWNGLTLDKVVKKYGFSYDKNPSVLAMTPEDGESITDFNDRVNMIISELVDKYSGCRLTIVTGSNVIQSVVSKALSIPPEKQSSILIKTGSATQISYFENWSSLIYSGIVPL